MIHYLPLLKLRTWTSPSNSGTNVKMPLVMNLSVYYVWKTSADIAGACDGFSVIGVHSLDGDMN